MNQLHTIIESNEFHEIVGWNENGQAFIIYDKKLFTNIILKKIKKFRSFLTFERVLMSYGFIKTINDKKIEFCHPLFLRGQPNLVSNIQKPKNQNENTIKIKNENDILNNILTEIGEIQRSISCMKTEIDILTRHNTHLKETVKFNSQQNLISSGKIMLLNDWVEKLQQNEKDKAKAEGYVPIKPKRKEHHDDESLVQHKKQKKHHPTQAHTPVTPLINTPSFIHTSATPLTNSFQPSANLFLTPTPQFKPLTPNNVYADLTLESALIDTEWLDKIFC